MVRSDNLPAAETYHDLKLMIYQLCWRHVRRFGGSWDEAVSIGNHAFMVAYNRFDRDRGVKFDTYMWHYVRGYLGKLAKPERMKTNTLDADCSDDEGHGSTAASQVPDRPKSGMSYLLSEVGDDARLIIGLVVDAPGELAMMAGAKPNKWRKALWRKLRSLGWSFGRVSVAFEEIKEALC